MAKKKANKKSSKASEAVFDSRVLPQNIVFFGEHVEENKNIYILQKTYKEIHKFTQNKTTNESGGMLLGYTIEEFGKTNVVINGFVEAKYCEATPTTLKFTHETWEYVHKEAEKKYPGGKIVGWIHTHPDFGIFLSEYDKFIHENFFSEDYQVAYVIDPIQNSEGFYFWINGKLERCKGFYVYDKTGAKIRVSPEAEDDAEGITVSREGIFSFRNVWIAILTIIVVFLCFANLSLNKEIARLQQQQETLAMTANQALAYVQTEQSFIRARVEELTSTQEEPEAQPEEAQNEDNIIINEVETNVGE